MRKFFFFLLLIPALASLGHDAYMYYQEPEKDFRLSDLGALWDKYHKESHDQWKTKVQEISKNVNELIPENPVPKDFIPQGLIPGMEMGTPEEPDTQAPAEIEETAEMIVEEAGSPPPAGNFSEGFTQSIERDGSTNVRPLRPEDFEDDMEKNTSTVIKWIGFLLEQKAVLVLGAIPLFFFALNLLLSPFFKEKEEMDKVQALKKKKKRKGGGYTYSRK